MHVGFALLTLFPGRVGGSETYVRGVLGAFADGHGPEQVTVLASRHVVEPYTPFERGPVRLREVTSYRPGDGSATRLAAMVAARLTPRRVARDVPLAELDVLHHPVTVPIPHAGGRPRVVTLQDLQHHELPQMFSVAERRFRAWAYDDSARTADVVLVPSAYTRAALERYVGVPAERVVVAPHGIDHERFTPVPVPDPMLDGLDLPDRFVVFPGNLWPHKNHARLIEGLALAADRDLTLVLTGQQGPRLPDLLGIAQRHGVAGRVRHLGYLPAASVPELYRRATGMVFPSLFEGFGFPVLEAMACGCPVAASTAGSLAELAGDATIRLDPEDPHDIARALDELAGDEGRRAQLREAGLRRAAQYRWETAARAHVEAYARAAADS